MSQRFVVPVEFLPVELDAVRTFVAAADLGQFQGAADSLEVTQQAVSKRVAGLEKELGVRLFTRTARGATLTIDGQAFLPHARALLSAAERAVAAVRPGQRALRVEVPGRRYPSSLIWRDDNPHPTLAALRSYVDAVTPVLPEGPYWLPPWSSVRTAGVVPFW
jgi:hypothetical protein